MQARSPNTKADLEACHALCINRNARAKLRPLSSTVRLSKNLITCLKPSLIDFHYGSG